MLLKKQNLKLGSSIPPFCFVLFCFVLSCFVLFCFVLFCFVLFCFVLFCFVCRKWKCSFDKMIEFTGKESQKK
jgi:hypothetical protein